MTNEELERVVAENPDVVPMRLRLVERYLPSHELANAQLHAEEAACGPRRSRTGPGPCATSGGPPRCWATPEQGEGLLVQSLALDPTNRDGLYFLARVRYELLDDPDLALDPLEQLRGHEMDDEQRSLIETLLAEVQVAVGVAATTTTGG